LARATRLLAATPDAVWICAALNDRERSLARRAVSGRLSAVPEVSDALKGEFDACRKPEAMNTESPPSPPRVMFADKSSALLDPFVENRAVSGSTSSSSASMKRRY
jgi:hypothetical protein